jgi:CheY-like chemotaxis protein
VNRGAHTKLTEFSYTAFTAVCCDDVMTPDDGNLHVVEDEPFLRKAVAAALRFLGFGVTAAENGTDALRLAKA